MKCAVIKILAPVSMTFLDFPAAQNSSKSAGTSRRITSSSSRCDNEETDQILKNKIRIETPKTETPAQRLLKRVPPKIIPIPSSDLLSRVAAFLPQLAASNEKILQKRPEEVNIEVLDGNEGEIIEMRLGLGLLEEKGKNMKKKSYISNENENDTDESFNENESISASSDEDSDSDVLLSSYQNYSKDENKNKKILVLPSEIRAAAAESKNQMDPFERVINSLLLFDGSSEEDEAERLDGVVDDDHDQEMENNEMLEFE